MKKRKKNSRLFKESYSKSMDYRKVDNLGRRLFSSTSISKKCYLAAWVFLVFFPFFSFLLPDYMLASSISQSTEQPRWVFFSEMSVEELNMFSCSDRTVSTFVCFLVYSIFRKISFTKTYLTLHTFLRPVLIFLDTFLSAQNQNLSFANKLLFSLGWCIPPTIYRVTCRLVQVHTAWNLSWLDTFYP